MYIGSLPRIHEVIDPMLSTKRFQTLDFQLLILVVTECVVNVEMAFVRLFETRQLLRALFGTFSEAVNC